MGPPQRKCKRMFALEMFLRGGNGRREAGKSCLLIIVAITSNMLLSNRESGP